MDKSTNQQIKSIGEAVAAVVAFNILGGNAVPSPPPEVIQRATGTVIAEFMLVSKVNAEKNRAEKNRAEKNRGDA